MSETIYNYLCIQDECENKKTIKAPKSKCPKCGKRMKKLGIATNIMHIGTQESLNNMKR